MHGHDIIVIGASAGGVEALPRALKQLPKNFPAAFFVVLHVSPANESYLPKILARSSSLPAVHPNDGDHIEKGKIYVAPPDNHLWLKNSSVRVTKGPRVNRHRPAVDPLFESAAHVYGPRVVGVILTGSLDDGTTGLHTVKECGGVAIVQNPEDALVPSMPQSAMQFVEVDHVLPLPKIRPLLIQLSKQKIKNLKIQCPEKVRFDMETAMMTPDEMEKKCGPPSSFICPECNGPLWEIRHGAVSNYRCLVGHSFSPEALIAEEGEALERALWIAVKTLEERSTILRRMSNRAREMEQVYSCQSFEEKAKEAERDARVIKKILKTINC